MFILSRIEETVTIEPKDLGKDTSQSIAIQIQKMMLDKIIHNLGLVISLYDIQDISHGKIYPNHGIIHYTVIFRLIIFRPFLQEIMSAKLKRASKSGLYLSTGFFDDIFIPEHYLPEPSFFDTSENLWFWKYGEDNENTFDLYIEINDEIRFRVKQIKFNREPTIEEIEKTQSIDPKIGTKLKPFVCMEIIGEISQSGLGPLAWWNKDV